MQNIKNNLINDIKELKEEIKANQDLINTLIPQKPQTSKGKTYNELCYIAQRDGKEVDVIDYTIYQLKMINSHLDKALYGKEQLLKRLKKVK